MSHELIAALVTVSIFSSLLLWALLCDRLHRHQGKFLFEDGSAYEVGARASSHPANHPRRYQAEVVVRQAEPQQGEPSRNRITGTHG